MRAIIQRVSSATVSTTDGVISYIHRGLLVLVGFEEADTEEDLIWMCKKIIHLRIFNDDKGIMNLSVQQVGGDLLVVSQFTLHASTKKGNRPSYIKAAKPETALPLYEKFIALIQHMHGRPVATGIFGAHMSVALINDGPVTIIIDSKNKE